MMSKNRKCGEREELKRLEKVKFLRELEKRKREEKEQCGQ
jgi:hypothetical protein